MDAFEQVAAEAVQRRYAQTPTERYRAKRYGATTDLNDLSPTSGVEAGGITAKVSTRIRPQS